MLSRAAAWSSTKQAIKTAVAGVISILVTNLFHLPQGYWAAISALIVMQSNVGATLSASRTRLAGTAVGALVGGVFMAIFGPSLTAFGLGLTGFGLGLTGFALAVAIAFFLCDWLRLAESQRLATVTVAIIMLIPATTSAWIVALHRFVEVALGIVIALAVSLVLWPNHARRSVRQGLSDTLRTLALLYRAVMHSYRGREDTSVEPLKSEVSAAIQKNAGLLRNALDESFGPLKEREMLALLVGQVERIFHAVETLEFGVRDSAADTYARNFASGLEQLEEGIAAALETLAKSLGAGKVYPEWPDLGAMIGALDDQAAQSRRTGAPIHYPLDEILRFYFLLFTCRNLINELESVHTLLTRLRGR
jgi:uncharacterized membrane protein YccC